MDHAFIVAGGEVTKAARNWLGGQLDAIKRSQVIFIPLTNLLERADSHHPSSEAHPADEARRRKNVCKDI